MKRPATYRVVFIATLLAFSVTGEAAEQSVPKPGSMNWEMIAARRPDLKVLVMIESEWPLCLQDLAVLADRGLVPADRDPDLIVGLERAVFTCRLDKWMKARSLPGHLSGKVLERFAMKGIYRVGFRVEAEGHSGPLEIEITGPRDGFGRKLIDSEHVVRPSCEKTLTTDGAGNRWLKARFANVSYGEAIKFLFGFEYHVDMRELLEHDLILAGKPTGTSVPADVQLFLQPGYKINPKIPSAVAWAARGGSQQPNTQNEYRRLMEFIKRTVVYDKRKRAAYFGGKMVYPDVDLMYQEVGETLARRAGCCPDTILLECAFLRARGVPCLTAGRFGHFYTILYVPGRGWMSTSVTPTGIPLIKSPGPDHVPYQRWQPKIPLTTVHWEARLRIYSLEE